MIKELFPMLSTPDLPRALGFYRDLLGGEVTYQFPEDHPEFVTVTFGTGTLGIGLDRAENHGEAQLPFALCGYVSDCDTAVERLRGEGVPVLAEPVDQPWGERMAVVADPDGYRVVLVAKRAPEAGSHLSKTAAPVATTLSGMETNRSVSVWPVLIYDDARAAIRFLVDTLGFEETAVYADDSDDDRVVHAELRWPVGGGVMLGSTGAGQEPFSSLPRGAASTYLATADPDGLFARATGAGAEVVRDLRDEDYGSRGFTIRDPEGNLWSFGTYAGE